MLRSLTMKAQAAASAWRQDALLRAIRPAPVPWCGGHQQQQHAQLHSSQLPMRLLHGRARSHSSLAPAAAAAAGGSGGGSCGGSPAAAVAVLEESGERIEEKELHVEASESYLAYAMSVIVGRALPDVRDGLKPVHRRILFAMHDLGISAGRPYKKCARVVGEVLGKYHPHGDSAVYDALVRLAQDFSMQLPLVSGHGNFGSLDNDPPAAMRYTECRLAGAAEDLLLDDLEADTVDWAPTFDASQDEPLVLPAKVPHLLVNGAQGIAVGIATKIPPHNLAEVVAALRALVAQPDISSAALMRHIPAPDFPTGGELLVGPETEAAYATGNGSVLLRATAAIEYEGAGSSGKKRASSAKAKAAAPPGDAAEAAASGKALVVFSEMPYQVCKADLVSRIAELVESKVLDGIADVRDESDRTGVRLVVEVRRGFSPQLVLNQLYKHTRLQLRFAANMVALVGGVPKTLTLRDFLQHFLDFRVSVIERRAQHRLAKAAARLHLVEGLLAALEQLDAVVQAIRAAQDGPAAKAALVASFGLTEAQAEGVLGMTLRRLTGLEAGKLREEQGTLTATIADLQALLADRQRVLQVVLDEAQAAADKHGQPRRSRIVSESPAAAELKEEDVVPNTPSLITVSSRGFIKRMPSSSWEAQRRGGTGKSGAKLRENEALQELLSLTAHDTLLFLSAGGRAHAVKAHKVPEASRTAAGTSISQVLGLPAPERFPALLAVRSFSEPGLSLAMATTTGGIKQTPLQAFSKMTKAGLGAIKLLEGEQLAGGALAADGSQVILASSGGKLARFKMSTVRQASRTAGCIKGMKLPPGQQLVSMAVLPPALAQGTAAAGQQQPQDNAGAGTDGPSSSPGPWLLLVTSKGFGKRVPLADIPLKVQRGAQGVVGVKLSPGDSLALAQLVFSGEDDVVLASKQGMMTRVGAAGIRVLSRAAKGVILCRLKEGDEIQSLAVVPAEHKDALA